MSAIFRGWITGLILLAAGLALFVPSESKDELFTRFVLGLLISCVVLSAICMVSDVISGNSLLGDGFLTLGLAIVAMLVAMRA